MDGHSKKETAIGDKTDSTTNPYLLPPFTTIPRNVGICIIGGHFYYGKEIPLLKNKYVFADFNGSIFALVQNEEEDWIRQPVKIVNKPGGFF